MRPSRTWRSRTSVLALLTVALLGGVLALGLHPQEPPPCVHAGGPPTTAHPRADAADERHGPVGWEAFRRLEDLPMLTVGTQPRMFSSADPTGGNADGFSSAYLCQDGDEYVLGEHAGPGELTSLWFTRDDGRVAGNGRLRIELDGRTVVDAPLQEVVDGGLGPPFVPPLVGNADQSSGGSYIQVPMPFRRSMRVTTDAAPRFHRIQYRVFADATGVTTFTPTDPASDVVATLRAAGSGPPGTVEGSTRTVRRAVRLAAGETSPPLRLSGPGVVSELQLRLPQVPTLPQTDRDGVPSGSTETALDVDPDNDGVRIVRRTQVRADARDVSVLIDGDVSPWSFGPVTRAPDGQYERTVELPGSLMSGRRQVRLADVDPGRGALEVRSFVRGAWVVTDRVALPAPAPPVPAGDTEPGRLLRDLRLRITFDGRQTVDAPVGEYFGVGLGERPVATLLFAVDPEDGYRAWWPMPFAREAVVELVNESDTPIVAGDVQLTWQADARWEQALGPGGRAGYFHATSHRGPVTPGEDWDLATLDGHGRVVGFVQTMVGRESGRFYLEGDERIHVDGARSPQLHGTGTEDLHLAGWYYNRGPFTTAFSGLSAHLDRSHGCPRECDAAYRVLLADALPFHANLSFGIEHGPTNDVEAYYGSTTFWYGRPNTSLRRTDLVDVGSDASERAHAYRDPAGQRRQLTATYPGHTDPRPLVDELREGHGEIRFTVALDSDNAGVLLRRRADQAQPGQAARVLVDDVPVGVWYEPGGNAIRRWLDHDLLVSARSTRGRESVEVTLRPLPGAPPWTAARYEVFSLQGPGQ